MAVVYAAGLAAVAVRCPWARCRSALAPVQQQLQLQRCVAPPIRASTTIQTSIITQAWIFQHFFYHSIQRSITRAEENQ